MKTRAILALTGFLAVSQAAAQYSQEQDQPAGEATLDVQSDPTWGAYLVDQRGMALYMFTADSRNVSNCYDDCAEAWPPLLTEAEPELGDENLDEALVGVIERKDGARQVTYGGWPLYYFVKDQKPGDVTGQDVHGFDGEWYLVSPEGNRIEQRKPES